jgi:CelD/BcsL family acetyltransferase involved in cellulose biosynthesis
MALVVRIEPTVTSSLAREWDELADRATVSPFLRPGWVIAGWRCFGTGDLAAVTVRQDSQLVGLLPFVERHGVFRSPTTPETPEFGILADGETASQALAHALIAKRPRRIDLGFLEPSGIGFRSVRAAAKQVGYRPLTSLQLHPPYITIDGDWAGYEHRLGTRRLREFRRRRRRLAELGPLSVQVSNGQERLEELLEEGFEVEGSGWKQAQGTAIKMRPSMFQFYTEVARWAAERGWLRLGFLRLAGHAIAFDFALEQAGIHYLVKTGYDEAYSSLAPGLLLRHEMIARAFALGIRRYDFLGTDAGWKLPWAVGVSDRVRLQCFAPTLPGIVDHAAFVHVRPVYRRVRGIVSTLVQQ